MSGLNGHWGKTKNREFKMRTVEISKNIWTTDESNKKGYNKLTPIGFGIFHQFGVNYDEFGNGPGNFSTAIVELQDGSIMNVPVEHIRFIND